MKFDRYALHNLLTVARNNNKRLEITGMLLYADKRFIQVLEGEKQTVLSLYNTIQKDSRHFNSKIVLETEIDKRNFPGWTMGYKNINPIEYKNIPGLNLFLDDDKVSKPYELLLSFKDDHTCFQDELSK